MQLNCQPMIVLSLQLAIFRTSNSRGWGVKTLQKIKRGTFVMEYVGEVGEEL